MKTLTIAALLGVLAHGWRASATAAEGKPLAPSLTVVGTGEVTARPDLAVVQVGVVTQALSAAKALQENNEAMSRLFKALTARGIAEKDVQTANFHVAPRHRNPQRGEPAHEIIGYQVSNQVRVKVRQLTALGPLLDELVGEGANQVHGIQFTVAEPNQLLDEARRKAVANARHKAELYADAAGVKLGRVLLVQEQAPSFPHAPVAFGGVREAVAAVPVAPGEQEFQATITVTYALE
jgi:uncharacterized protein YggE